MKILLVSPGFPPDKTGGIENHVQMLSSQLRDRGHTVHILTRYHQRDLADSDIVQIKRPAGEFYGYGTWAIKAWLKSWSLDHDLVHFHGFDGQILSMTPFLSPRKIVHVHNSLTMEPERYKEDVIRHRIGYFLASESFRRARIVMAPTETVKQDIILHIRDIDPKKIRIVPNFIDPERYRHDGTGEDVRRKYSLEGKFVILYFGKIKRTKGIEDLCKAFRILKQKIDTALIIGGAPTATSKYFKYLSSTYTDVIFTGYVPDSRPYYEAADTFVIYTPGFEGGEVFPIALLEAMSMGLPVVCSESPIFREVTKGNAIFSAPQNPEALAESLYLLSKDPEKASEIGKKNREMAETFYNVRNVGGKIEEIYKEVCET